MLGTDIPSAIGAKLGAGDREVVCLTGDGAAGCSIMEMQSAAREKLAITTIVFAKSASDGTTSAAAPRIRRDRGCEPWRYTTSVASDPGDADRACSRARGREERGPRQRCPGEVVPI
jgi:TPP-dependent trihydroxycyclohexane-1,2-dione (THcHDO) dehydratase